jgi:hypothetical protein
MTDRLVVRGPQAHVTGNRDQRDAAGLEHPGDLRRGEVVLFDVLKHIEGGDQVARLRTNGQFPRVGPDHVDAALSCDLRRHRSVFERERLPAMRSEHAGIAAAGRANVQRLSRGWQPSQFPRQQSAAFFIPPVAVFYASQRPKLSCFHGLNGRGKEAGSRSVDDHAADGFAVESELTEDRWPGTGLARFHEDGADVGALEVRVEVPDIDRR